MASNVFDIHPAQRSCSIRSRNKDTSPRKRHSWSFPREGLGWLPSYTKEDKWSWNLYLKLNFNQFFSTGTWYYKSRIKFRLVLDFSCCLYRIQCSQPCYIFDHYFYFPNIFFSHFLCYCGLMPWRVLRQSEKRCIDSICLFSFFWWFLI